MPLYSKPLPGPAGPAGGQEIAYAETLSTQALTLAGGVQDITSLQITVSTTGVAFWLECYVGFTVTNSGTSAAGDSFAPSYLLTDSSNTIIASITETIVLGGPATTGTTQTFRLVRKRMAALGSSTTYKVRMNPTASSKISAFSTYTSTSAEPIYIQAITR